MGGVVKFGVVAHGGGVKDLDRRSVDGVLKGC